VPSDPGLRATWIPLGVLSRWIDEVIAVEAGLHRLLGASVVGPWPGGERAVVAALAEEHGQHAISWLEVRPDRFDQPAVADVGRVARLLQVLDHPAGGASSGVPGEPTGAECGPEVPKEVAEEVSPTLVRTLAATVVACLVDVYEAVGEASVYDPVIARRARRLAAEERAGLAELTGGRVAPSGGDRPDPRTVAHLLAGGEDGSRPEGGPLEEVLDLLVATDGLRPIGFGTWPMGGPEGRVRRR